MGDTTANIIFNSESHRPFVRRSAFLYVQGWMPPSYCHSGGPCQEGRWGVPHSCHMVGDPPVATGGWLATSNKEQGSRYLLQGEGPPPRRKVRDIPLPQGWEPPPFATRSGIFCFAIAWGTPSISTGWGTPPLVTRREPSFDTR